MTVDNNYIKKKKVCLARSLRPILMLIFGGLKKSDFVTFNSVKHVVLSDLTFLVSYRPTNLLISAGILVEKNDNQ